MEQKDVVIIGGGPAGLAAAVELHKQGIRNMIILEREAMLGGILRPVSYTHLDVYKRQAIRLPVVVSPSNTARRRLPRVYFSSSILSAPDVYKRQA